MPLHRARAWRRVSRRGLVLCLLFVAGNTLAILVAGNLGHMLAHFFALSAFLRLHRRWVWVAGLLAAVNGLLIAIGATNPSLTGSGSQSSGCQSCSTAFAEWCRTRSGSRYGRARPPNPMTSGSASQLVSCRWRIRRSVSRRKSKRGPLRRKWPRRTFPPACGSGTHPDPKNKQDRSQRSPPHRSPGYPPRRVCY
jgi:hypothetical protein